MYLDLFKTPVEKRAEWLKEIFLSKKGYPLDLENPKTFTEKIQWYKTYYQHPDLHRIVDKVEFKNWIQEKLQNHEASVAKLIKVWNTPEEVDLKDIPQQCVIKSNCMDLGRCVKIIKNKDEENLTELEGKIKTEWFDIQKSLVNSFCSGYHKVLPKVFVEEYLPSDNGQSLLDYKLFCFSGQPEFFYMINESIKDENGLSPLRLYTIDWKGMDVKYKNYSLSEEVQKPIFLNEMIEISKKLSNQFPFVRIDYVISNNKLYITELTFYPTGGWMTFEPQSFDRYLGDLFITNTKEK